MISWVIDRDCVVIIEQLFPYGDFIKLYDYGIKFPYKRQIINFKL